MNLEKQELSIALAEILDIQVQGHKGEKKQSAPVESPDSLRSIAMAKILDLISEGEIEGFVTAVASGVPTDVLKDVYLDETPVANADGSLNFKNVQVDTRVGTQTQDYITGFPSVENEVALNTELTYASPFVRAISNLTLSALRVRLSVSALSEADPTTGNITGHSVQYAIDISTDGGAYVEKLNTAFVGKTGSPYERSHRIDLPVATVSGWSIRVRRLTTNQASAYIQDVTNVVSVTEIIDVKMRYPNSALVGIQIDASQFQNIPRRSYHIKGRRIKVPTNYNPITRVYATTGAGTANGAWDGTFKTSWTDNPTWIFYDLVTHPRYGLGHLVNELQVDKWALYGISIYCDQMVDDGSGNGTLEPRFTCNLFLQQQADAFKVLQDLASVFRGICYWSNGAIVPVADRPSDPVYTYTNANVEGGLFKYEGSGRRARHTVALVSWSDPSDFGRAKVEYVEDPDGIERYGVQQTEVIGIGTTRRSEARRIGREILLTERLETNTCTWTVGIDGTYAVPGQIVRVADQFRTGRRLGGRIASATAGGIIIDAWSAIMPVVGDTIIVTLPNGVTQDRIIQSIDVATRGITPTVNFSSVPGKQSIWATESAALKNQLFRIISVTEAQEGLGFVITGLSHNPTKFNSIDNGGPVEIPITSVVPSAVQFAPDSVTLSAVPRAGYVIASTLLQADWPRPVGAVAFMVQWRASNGNWTDPQRVTSNVAEVSNPFPGLYRARVAAVNALNVISVYKESADFTVVDQTLEPGFSAILSASVTSALTAAHNAQATADGAVVSFFQTTPPTIGVTPDFASVGDIWFDTDDGNKLYRVVGTVWTLAADDDLAAALLAASTAQAAADGKIETFFQAGPPIASGNGDLWFESDNGNYLWRWSSIVNAWLDANGKSVAQPLSIAPDGSVTIDCQATEQFTLLLTANVTIDDFINVPPAKTILIEVKQASPGNFTVSFGGSVTPVSGQPYVASPAVGATDVLGLSTIDGGLVWRLVKQQPIVTPGGVSAPSVTIAPSPAAATGTSTNGSLVTVSNQVTATVVGGTAPFTYSWSRAPQSDNFDFLISGATTAAPTMSTTNDNVNYSSNQDWRATVTDAGGLTAQATVSITLSRTGSSAGGGGGGSLAVTIAPNPASGYCSSGS